MCTCKDMEIRTSLQHNWQGCAMVSGCRSFLYWNMQKCVENLALGARLSHVCSVFLSHLVDQVPV